MGLRKNGATAETIVEPARVAEETKVDSGTQAAVDRLTKTPTQSAVKSKSTGRDFDAEAHGKTRCALYAAALASPGLAGLKFKNYEEYAAIIRKAAEDGEKFSFEPQEQ